jgi:hypothetical protein
MIDFMDFEWRVKKGVIEGEAWYLHVDFLTH